MIRIVLVEPREAGNVGAAARVMKNFGLEELWIAGEHPPLNPLAGWWASGADDVVERARRVPTLFDALGDAHVTVATTSLRGRSSAAGLGPFDVAQLNASLRADQTLALVFGREDSGLTSEEVALCQRTASIPTWPEFPTMNLAQSVAIFAYELGKGARPPAPEREPAPHHLQQRLNRHARALFEEIGYFGDKSPDRVCAELQALTGRAVLTMREASLLLALVRRLDKTTRTTE